MLAYCSNNAVSFVDPTGLCMEVGALLTWVDCGNPSCATSSLRQPTRYYSGDNRPKHKNYVKQHQIAQKNRQLENEVRQLQIQLIEESLRSIWNEYDRGYNSLQQAQMQNTQLFVDGTEYLWANREDAIDFAVAAGAFGIALKVGYTVVVGSNVTLLAVGGAIWGVLWTGRNLYRSFDALFS